jgi:diphthamide synthase (EF-2-diphthine--ammonia ligase)
VIYGDIFLEEIRKYREEQLGKLGLGCVFPIWGRDSLSLARTFLEAGFKAVVVCVDSTLLDGEFAGREFDRDFITGLPPEIDPCGENGEFHTSFMTDPYSGRVEFVKGEIVLRDGRFIIATSCRNDGVALPVMFLCEPPSDLDHDLMGSPSASSGISR